MAKTTTADSTDIPPNPEIEPVEGVEFADAGELGGTVYKTSGVPNLLCEVLPGQHVKVPDEHEVGDAGDYYEGQQFATHGPTAHMLEARGFVKVIGTVGG